jgi:hypothetical protein
MQAKRSRRSQVSKVGSIFGLTRLLLEKIYPVELECFCAFQIEFEWLVYWGWNK